MFDISRNTSEYIELDVEYSVHPTRLASTLEGSEKDTNSPDSRTRNDKGGQIIGESSPRAELAANQKNRGWKNHE